MAVSQPTPPQIKDARQSCDMTQKEAGELVYGTRRTWQDWERGERGMHPGLFELFLLKARRRSA